MKNIFALFVTATNSDGTSAPALQAVALADQPENFSPVITNNGPFTIDENLSNGSLVGDVDATDPDGDTLTYSITGGNTDSAFAINSTDGKITVNDSTKVNWESITTFTLTVQVQDNGQGNLFTTTPVVINLNNINDAPVINPQSFTIPENTANSTVIGAVTASDEDAGTGLTYTITATDNPNGGANPFAIHPTTGVLSVSLL